MQAWIKPIVGAAIGLMLANAVLAQLPPNTRRLLGG